MVSFRNAHLLLNAAWYNWGTPQVKPYAERSVLSRAFDAGDYGEYVTDSGKTRLRRLPPGVLEKRIRDVCVAWLKGEIEVDGLFTVSKIKRATEAMYNRPVSDYGVDQALRRWGSGRTVLERKRRASVVAPVTRALDRPPLHQNQL